MMEPNPFRGLRLRATSVTSVVPGDFDVSAWFEAILERLQRPHGSAPRPQLGPNRESHREPQ